MSSVRDQRNKTLQLKGFFQVILLCFSKLNVRIKRGRGREREAEAERQRETSPQACRGKANPREREAVPGGSRRRLSCVLHPRPALARRLCRQMLPPGPPSLKDRDGGHCGGGWRTQGAWRPVLDSAGGRGGVRRKGRGEEDLGDGRPHDPVRLGRSGG